MLFSFDCYPPRRMTCYSPKRITCDVIQHTIISTLLPVLPPQIQVFVTSFLLSEFLSSLIKEIHLGHKYCNKLQFFNLLSLVLLNNKFWVVAEEVKWELHAVDLLPTGAGTILTSHHILPVYYMRSGWDDHDDDDASIQRVNN